MKPVATMEAPDAGAATGELLTHEFTADGAPINPEHVVVPMPKGYACTILLALAPDGEWRVGYEIEHPGSAKGDHWCQPSLNNGGFRERSAALVTILASLSSWLADRKGTKPGVKALNAFAEKITVSNERSPANTPDQAPEEVVSPEPAEVSCEAIEYNPHNDRKEFPADYISELASSIAREGLLQRIGVKLLESTEETLPGVPPAPRYRLLYGECRLRAVRELKLKTIRAEVYPVTLSPRLERRIIKVENLKRRNLNPIEEAQGYADHMAEFGLTQDQMAKEVNKSRPVIANALRLLDLPAAAREPLAAGLLTPAHGTALARFKAWPDVCAKLAELAVKHKAAAAQLEKNLPFAEELVDAKLAVDLNANYHRFSLPKEHANNPAFFIWEDRARWTGFAYSLDVTLGKELLAAAKAKRDAEAEREAANYRSSSQQRGKDGELTSAAKRARQKTIDENQANRLAVMAIGHRAVTRLATVSGVDPLSVAVVVAEALSHCGDVDELAETLGIKLPKRFSADNPEHVQALAPVDALRLAAAGIAQRETDDAMRYAAKPHHEVLFLSGAESEQPSVDVETWKIKIRSLVQAGKNAEAIENELKIPQFLAVTLVRAIKREIREAKEAPPAKPAAAPKAAPVKAAKKSKRATIDDGVRSEVRRLAEAGRTGAEIAKKCGISLPSVQNIKKALGLVKARA